MATVKLIFKKDKSNSSNEHPLYLRITKNRRSKYVSLGIHLKKEYWDEKERRVKKSFPNAQRLNNYIATKMSEAQGIALDMETSDKTTLPDQIKEQIVGKAPVSFVKYADNYIRDLEINQKIGTYRHTKSIVKKMKEYLKGRDLLFDQITVPWLKAYEQHLKVHYGNKINTINADFRTIRRIINLAILDEVISNENPFKRFKLTLEKVKRDFLTEEELTKIEFVELEENSNKDHHRNMFIFSAYAGGLRISDVLMLRWRNFDGEKIIVQTKKTSSVVSIKLPTKALSLVNKYKTENVKPEDYIFPILNSADDYSNKIKLYSVISSRTSYCNDDLKDIAVLAGITDKKISFHIARHTFATRALRKGMRIEYVSKIMGHSNISITQIYAKIINEDLDNAMSVLGESIALYMRESA